MEKEDVYISKYIDYTENKWSYTKKLSTKKYSPPDIISIPLHETLGKSAPSSSETTVGFVGPS